MPLYATLPNEGSTYGLMPVLLRVNPAGDTTSILAPSASWNKVVKLTGTFRGYRFFSETRSLTLLASASSRVNRSASITYLESTRQQGAATSHVVLAAKQNIFFRFFGLGPETSSDGESSYTRRFLRGFIRQGLNLREGFNLAFVLEARADDTRRQGVPGLPLAQDRYGDTVSFEEAVIVSQGLSVSYDSRPHGDYSLGGFASELTATANEGLANAEPFVRLVWHSRGLWRQTSWLLGAARLSLERVLGPDVRFYYQAALGGELLLRGFTENRFLDRGSWCLDLEERIRLFRTNIFGVAADWRVDPFVTVGQVYGDLGQVFRRVRTAAGLGFRAWVHPNIVGRVDAAYGGEGLKVYVVLGYPLVIRPEVGLAVVAVSLYRLVPIALNTLAWQRLIPPARRPPFRLLLVLRWIGEAVNSLVPWSQAGGDVVRARLLSRQGLPAPDAAAVMIADLALSLLTQILYAALGLAAGATRGTPATRRQLLGLAAIAGGVLVLAGGAVLTRTLINGRGARRWPGLARRLEEFHAAFRTLALDHRNLIACSAWHLVAWLSQVGETWLVLAACGAPVSLADALWLESLTAGARSLAFFLPAGLGAQEVALLALGRSLGLDSAAVVTLTLVKRIRELCIGGLGLVAWALVRRAGAREQSA